jgi:hypothetical protein
MGGHIHTVALPWAILRQFYCRRNRELASHILARFRNLLPGSSSDTADMRRDVLRAGCSDQPTTIEAPNLLGSIIKGYWNLADSKSYGVLQNSFACLQAIAVNVFEANRCSVNALLVHLPSFVSFLLLSFSSAMSFMWAVGINITSTILLETPTAVGGYGFGSKSVGFLYFTPLVAVSLGEFFGHFFNDFVANRYVRKHNGVFKPEARLVTNYVAAAFMIPGLIIVGQTLENHLSYAGIIMGWGMYVFGVMLATVSTTAYLLDSYGSASSEVSGLLNFARGKYMRSLRLYIRKCRANRQ